MPANYHLQRKAEEKGGANAKWVFKSLVDCARKMWEKAVGFNWSSGEKGDRGKRQKKDRCIGLDASRDKMTDSTTERVSTLFLCFQRLRSSWDEDGRYDGSSGEILPTLVRLIFGLGWSLDF